MPAFAIETAIARAQLRLGRRAPDGDGTRRRRSDRGQTRLPSKILNALVPYLEAPERPPMAQMLAVARAQCKKIGRRPLARATLYTLLGRAQTPQLPTADLPLPVREALYNLQDVPRVPAHQVAFYCFNYGAVAAMSFASGMGWLALYQAARMRGWRPKSLGVLRAVMRLRGI